MNTAIAFKPETVSKVCSRCKERKLTFEFYASNNNGTDNLRTRCKVCERGRDRRSYSREWREKNRESANAYAREYHHQVKKHKPGFKEERVEYARWHRRLKKYGITEEGYYAHLMAQNGKCAICGDQRGMELRVDHDHSTGAIRALLCTTCNSGLGLFKEDPGTMRKAIEYLEKHSESDS